MLKKEKGISIVQVLVVLGLFGAGLVSVSGFWGTMERDNRLKELAYILAKEQYEFARALDGYIQDNIGQTLPYEIDAQTLKDEGYLSEYSYDGKTINDGIDELGTVLSGRVSSPFGFTQSVAVVQEGPIPEEKLKYYNLGNKGKVNKEKLETIYREASKNILGMTKKYTGTIVIKENSDDIIRTPFSESEDSVYDYFSTSEFNNDANEIMFSTFVNMEKEPGYWVLRYDLFYPSHRYGGPTGQYQELRSLGYSSYCPSPGNAVPRDRYVPGSAITLNPSASGGLSMTGSWVTVGELVGFQYICLPATKIMVPDNEYDINTSGSHQTFPTKNLNCTNSYREGLGLTNTRRYATTTANTFSIGDIKYSLVMKAISMTVNCDAVGGGSLYMHGNLFRGGLPNRVDIIENNIYQDRVNNINTKNIILR